MDSEVLIAVLLIISVGLFLYFYYLKNTVIDNTYSDESLKLVDDEQIVRFKRAFQKQSATLSSDDDQRINKYQFDQSETLFDSNSKSWDEDDIKIRELIQFGFKLLTKYSQDKSFEKGLKISTDIVLRIGRIVNGLLEINVTHESKNRRGKNRKRNAEEDDELEEDDEVDTIRKRIPRREPDTKLVNRKLNRFTFSVYIPRLLAMYEYIGNDNCIKKYVCHPIITKLNHALNKSLDKTESGSNMVQFAFPRLLSNYLFDRETYTTEKNSSLFQDLCKFYNITYNLSADGPKNGVYEDGSCLYHNSVPRYSNLFMLLGFYENIFASFGIDYNFHDIVEPIIDKLFHPEIEYVTFGLYSDDGERTKSMKGKLGIVLMPYMGLGLFKSSHFMFSLRVQRPGISAFFKPSKDSEDTFALGWIQMRKMYLKNMFYPHKLTWDLLKEEPGIILFENQNTYVKFTLPTGQSSVYTKMINSFVGRVPDEEVMFWMNEYQFTEYYQDIIITEMGVVTNNGVEIFYCTNKDSPDGKKLLIRVKDPDNSTLYYKPESSNGLAQLTKEGLTLRMVYNQDDSVKVQRNATTKNMEFEYNSKKYSVQVLTPNENYAVNVTRDGTIIKVFGGSSKSELSDTMTTPGTAETKTLVRSPVTYMYE